MTLTTGLFNSGLFKGGLFNGGIFMDNRSANFYLMDCFFDFLPSVKTISGYATYPDNDFEMTGTSSIGGYVFSVTGGDPVSDLGTICTAVVLEDATGNKRANVTWGYSGSDVSLVYPCTIEAVKLSQAYGQLNNQHLSPAGQKAMAHHIKTAKKSSCYARNAIYAAYHNDQFTTTPASSSSDAQTWKPYGIPGSYLSYVSSLNVAQGTEKLICAASQYCVQAITVANGKGAELTLSVPSGKYVLSFSFGSRSVDCTIRAQIFEDAVSVFDSEYNAGVRRIQHEIDGDSVSECVIRITRTNTDSTSRYLRLGSVFLVDISSIYSEKDDPVISNDATVLLVGDSWFDDENINGASFDSEFRAIHTGDVYNEAIAGSKISDWIDDFQGWIDLYKPDIVVLHSGINELNSSVSATDFWGHVDSLLNIANTNNVVLAMALQGCTASESQAQGLLNMMNAFYATNKAAYELRWPKLSAEWITSAAADEFTNSASVINNRNKVPGSRIVQRTSDSALLTPTGTADIDTWVSI
jgi:hypothetical protein